MRRNIIIIIVLGVLIWFANFYWKNFRGALPAIRKPKQDIAELVNPSTSSGINETGMPLDLPLGFSISIFAKDLGTPRVLAIDPSGNLLASIPSQGQVVALLDKDSDGIADETRIVIDELDRPHGMAFRCTDNECQLYVAETDQVAVYDYDQKNFKASNKKKIIDLPASGRHFSRTIIIRNDQLYISIGSSCDTCIEKDWRRAKILVADLDGSNLRTFASGLRNAVFMAAHPLTGHIWATEMGRDFLGDDLPPDEINIIDPSTGLSLIHI